MERKRNARASRPLLAVRVSALKAAGRTLDQAKAAKPVAGLADTSNSFFPEDQFVEAIWGSLDAHGQ